MDRMLTLAVIGTAGRKDDAARLMTLGRPFYDAMFQQVVDASVQWEVAHGVSGGAAWADHLAVRAFNEGALRSLTLYFPACWSDSRHEFEPNPSVRFNPGATLNRYHAAFSRAAGIDSFAELATALRRGAEFKVQEGFQRRNILVARDATHLLALTFGYIRPPVDLDCDAPGFGSAVEAGLKDGGTAHTWGEAWECRVKRHVSLGWLERELAHNPVNPNVIGR
jgi:hypothetical protein